MLNVKENELKNVGEDVGLELGAKFVSNFRELYPNENTGYFIGRDILDQILAQPGCVGIRYFNAVNEIGEKTLVYVGINSSGNIISQYTIVTESGEIQKKAGIVADRAGTDTWLEDLLRRLGLL